LELSPTSGPRPGRSTDPIPIRPRRAAEQAPTPQAAAGLEPQDHVDVSSLGRELAEAELRTGDGAELRFDLVARLRAEVRDGTYRLDAQALARAMIERGEQA
jgi:flagellar biosynthesis anti-sigma factor FlgM